MWMGRVNRINLDKHGINRTYLNLDGAGNSNRKGRAGCCLRADLDQELVKLKPCLQGLERLLKPHTTSVSSGKSGRCCLNREFRC